MSKLQVAACESESCSHVIHFKLTNDITYIPITKSHELNEMKYYMKFLIRIHKIVKFTRLALNSQQTHQTVQKSTSPMKLPGSDPHSFQLQSQEEPNSNHRLECFRSDKAMIIVSAYNYQYHCLKRQKS